MTKRKGDGGDDRGHVHGFKLECAFTDRHLTQVQLKQNQIKLCRVYAAAQDLSHWTDDCPTYRDHDVPVAPVRDSIGLLLLVCGWFGGLLPSVGQSTFFTNTAVEFT